jgi:PAS domain S-box-containing protein
MEVIIVSKTLRVLIIEDSEDDANLLLRELRRSGYDPVSERIETADTMRCALAEKQWDLIISDYTLPEFSCITALSLLKKSGLDLPFLIVSGVVGEDNSVEALKAGAHDYIMKGRYARLAPAIERELNEAKNRRERRQAVDELHRTHGELERQNRRLQEAFKELEMSRDRFSDLYDFAPLGYVTLDAKGIIREINMTGARLLGTPRAAIIGMRFKSFVRKEDGKKFNEHLEKFKHIREQVVTELAINTKEGAIIQAQLSSVPSQDEKGMTTCRTAITDITEIKQTEESLMRLNRLYAVLSETGKAIIHSADRDTLFHEICRVVVEHGGFLLAWVGVLDKESGKVRSVAAFGDTGYLEDIRISAKDEPEGRGPTGSAISEGTYCICNDFLNDPNTRPWRKKAKTYGFNSAASIALKLDNKIYGALTIYCGEKDFFKWQYKDLLQQMAADISFALDNLDQETRRRDAEMALQAATIERIRTMEKLRERDRLLLQQSRQAAMGEMIGNIAHQWRQPLNALGLTIQELNLTYEYGKFSKEYLEATVARAMDIIFHMSQTIDDFRNFYKPDKGKGWFKVDQVVAKTISLIEANFRERRIRIDISLSENMEIKGFPNEYAQVLLNILMNASDILVERNTAKPRVKVRAWMEEQRSVVTVTDNAGGIRENIMDKIFDLYFTTKENDLGTGIGLFMSKTIIEKNMGGHLTVRNTKDGAEFRIEV